MNKKITIGILTFALAIGMTACASKPSSPETNTQANQEISEANTQVYGDDTTAKNDDNTELNKEDYDSLINIQHHILVTLVMS